MYIERKMAETLHGVIGEYPIITVSGPRQSGKTTLAKKCLPEYGYVNLEEPDSAEFARFDPKGFIRRYPAPLVIDEVQRVPELMSYLQVRAGQVILSGWISETIHFTDVELSMIRVRAWLLYGLLRLSRS